MRAFHFTFHFTTLHNKGGIHHHFRKKLLHAEENWEINIPTRFAAAEIYWLTMVELVPITVLTN